MPFCTIVYISPLICYVAIQRELLLLFSSCIDFLFIMRKFPQVDSGTRERLFLPIIPAFNPILLVATVTELKAITNKETHSNGD